jgi:hypothetical protein
VRGRDGLMGNPSNSASELSPSRSRDNDGTTLSATPDADQSETNYSEGNSSRSFAPLAPQHRFMPNTEMWGNMNMSFSRSGSHWGDDSAARTMYCILDMNVFPRLHGWLFMSEGSTGQHAESAGNLLARTDSSQSLVHLDRTGSLAPQVASPDMGGGSDKKSKSLWTKLKHKVRGKKSKKNRKGGLSAYQKYYFEVDPLRLQLHWTKDETDEEDSKHCLDLKVCRITECRFEDVKRQHVFLVSEVSGLKRRIHIAAGDNEEYEIWRMTLKTISEKALFEGNPEALGTKEQRVSDTRMRLVV